MREDDNPVVIEDAPLWFSAIVNLLLDLFDGFLNGFGLALGAVAALALLGWPGLARATELQAVPADSGPGLTGLVIAVIIGSLVYGVVQLQRHNPEALERIKLALRSAGASVLAWIGRKWRA